MTAFPCLSIQGTRENDDVVREDLVQQDVQVSVADGGLQGLARSLMGGKRSGALGIHESLCGFYRAISEKRLRFFQRRFAVC